MNNTGVIYIYLKFIKTKFKICFACNYDMINLFYIRVRVLFRIKVKQLKTKYLKNAFKLIRILC